MLFYSPPRFSIMHPRVMEGEEVGGRIYECMERRKKEHGVTLLEQKRLWSIKKSEIIIGADKAGGMRTNEKAPEKGVIRKIKKKSRENEQKEYDRTHPADKAEPG